MVPEQFHALFTGIALLMMIGAIASGRFAVDVVVIGTLVAVLAAGVVTPEQAARGYSNTALITIGFLYVVAAGLRETGAIGMLSGWLLGRPKTALGAQARIVPTVAFMSAFANNTPIVATFMPILAQLSRRTGIPVGRLMMPLSFAAILGGLCTLIGTSTILIVAGLIREFADQHKDLAIQPMDMFTVTPVGLSVAVVGVIYVLVFGRVLLRAKQQEGIPLDRSRRYMTSMRIAPDSPVIDKALKETDLHQIPGAWLNRIEREGVVVSGVGLAEVLRAGDVLIFIGVLEAIKDLRQVRGLEPVDESEPVASEGAAPGPDYGQRSGMRLVEAVLSSTSPLIGRRVRDAGIRSRYDASVVAVHRLGHELHGKLGEIRLRPGDTLLLEAAPGFEQRYRDSMEFYLVGESEESATPRHDRAWVAMAIVAGFVLLLAGGQFMDALPAWMRPFSTIMTPMPAAMVAATLMVLTRCCRSSQARRSVDWSVLLVIGAAFGLGQAMLSSGLSEIIAKPLVHLATGLGPIAALATIYAMSVFFTTFVTNSAAAVLMFPIAYEVSSKTGIDLMAMAVCIAIGASAEFTTPIGYHTNLMVMGPGGYRFMDYVRFGGPLTLLSGAVAVTAAAVWFGLA